MLTLRYAGGLRIAIFDSVQGAWLQRVVVPECDRPREAPPVDFCQDETMAVAQGRRLVDKLKRSAGVDKALPCCVAVCLAASTEL